MNEKHLETSLYNWKRCNISLTLVLCLFHVFLRSSVIISQLYSFLSLFFNQAMLLKKLVIQMKCLLLYAIYILAKLRAWQGNCSREVKEQQVFPFRYLSAPVTMTTRLWAPDQSGNSMNWMAGEYKAVSNYMPGVWLASILFAALHFTANLVKSAYRYRRGMCLTKVLGTNL